MRRNLPPAFACWLVHHVLPARYSEAMLGDLIEEYSFRVESTSRFSASRWFWSQACRSMPPMLWSSLRSRDWLISMSVAVSVYLVMEILQYAANLTISKWVAPQPTTQILLAPVVFLTACTIGGCLAARIRCGATKFLALIVMITVAVLIDLKVCTIPVPWWYQFGFLTLGPLAVIFTPSLFGRSKQRGTIT